MGHKAVEIRAREGPRHAIRLIVRFTTTANNEKGAPWSNNVSNPPRGTQSQIRREHLERVDLQDEPEDTIPCRWARQEFGDMVPDQGPGKALPAPGDGGRRDVEGIHVEAATGRVLRRHHRDCSRQRGRARRSHAGRSSRTSPPRADWAPSPPRESPSDPRPRPRRGVRTSRGDRPCSTSRPPGHGPGHEPALLPSRSPCRRSHTRLRPTSDPRRRHAKPPGETSRPGER